MKLFFAIFVICFVLFMLIISVRAIYLAYVKRKDERSKWIVTKSMADSFKTITILQTIPFLLKWINFDFYQSWWIPFTEAFYIEPVMASFMVLGIILIINTKRFGGSL